MDTKKAGPRERSEEGEALLNQLLGIEAKRLHDLGALIADRMAQDPRDIGVDLATGQILGVLSDAARAAQYAVAQRIIQKGGEDPGWGR